MEFEIKNERAINFQGFDDYLDIYNKYGVVIFRNFFELDPLYTNY